MSTPLKQAFAALVRHPIHYLLLQIPEAFISFLGETLEPEAEGRLWMIAILFPAYCIASYLSISLTVASVFQEESGARPSFARSIRTVTSKASILLPVSIIANGIVLMGLAALVLPAIYFMSVYLFVVPYILTEPKAPWTWYLHKSKKLAKTRLASLLAVVAVLIALSLLVEFNVGVSALPSAMGLPAKLFLSALLSAVTGLWISYSFLDLKAINKT